MIKTSPSHHQGVDVRYTKAIKKESKLAGAGRDLKDIGHNVLFVGLGNAFVVAPARLAQQVFNLDSHTKWIKPLHQQRKETREGLPNMERHYAAQKHHAEMEEAQRIQALALANRTPEQKRFDALVELFIQVDAAVGNSDKRFPAKKVNQCVMDALKDLLDQGELAASDLQNATVNGKPGIYHAGGELRRLAMTKLPGGPTGEGELLRKRCQAAIARKYLEAGLIPEDLLQDIDPAALSPDQVFIADDSGTSRND